MIVAVRPDARSERPPARAKSRLTAVIRHGGPSGESLSANPRPPGHPTAPIFRAHGLARPTAAAGRGARAARCRPRDRGRPVRRAARAFGRRQVDAAEHPRRAGRAQRRRSLVRRPSLSGAGEAELTTYRREHVGFVFQFCNLIPSLTVRENVALVTDIAGSTRCRWTRRSPGRPDAAARPLPRPALRRRAAARCDRARHQTAAGAAVRRAHRRARLPDRQAGAGGDRAHHRELGTTAVVITHNAGIAGMADTA